MHVEDMHGIRKKLHFLITGPTLYRIYTTSKQLLMPKLHNLIIQCWHALNWYYLQNRS